MKLTLKQQLGRVNAIARVTRQEILKDKILYNILLFAVLLFGVSILAARLSFIQPDRILLDVGFSSVTLGCVAIGVLFGAQMVSREIERRTLWVALARSVSPTEFLLGKFMGCAEVVLINWALMVLVEVGVLSTLSEFGMEWVVLKAFLLPAFLGVMFVAVAMFFSSFTTTSLAVIFSIGTFLIGTQISVLRELIAQLQAPLLEKVLKALLVFIIPSEQYQLGFMVTYRKDIPAQYIIKCAAIALFYGVFLTVLAGKFIRSRERSQ